jgi:hypothetical protein
MSKYTLSRKRVKEITSVLRQSLPSALIYMSELEISNRTENVEFCEISGLAFQDEKDIFFVPVDPFSDNKVINIYNIAIVCREAYRFYKKICQYILENPDFPNIDDYKKSHLRFQLTKENVLKDNLEKEKIEIVDYSFLFANIGMKSSKERIKDVIANSMNMPVINNLQPPKPKKPIKRNVPALNAKPKKAKSKEEFYSERTIKRRISDFQERSIAKGFTCNMTFENSKHLFEIKHCQLTGMELKRCKKSKHALPNSFTIDRLNRFEGYTVANTIVMCYEANQIKSDLERYNYTENLSQLIRILNETKRRVLNKYKDNSEYKFKTSKLKEPSIIIEVYKDKKKKQLENRFHIS